MRSSSTEVRVLALGLTGLLAMLWPVPQLGQSATGTLNVAQFTPAGELVFPSDTDRWVVVGSSLGGDYSEGAFDPDDPGPIGIAQMEPAAYDFFVANGRYADGTMFLLSFYRTQRSPEPALRGFVQGELAGLEIHLIDHERADGRAFFMFAADDPGTAAALPAGSECIRCHAAEGAFDSTFTQFYPRLRDVLSADTE